MHAGGLHRGASCLLVEWFDLLIFIYIFVLMPNWAVSFIILFHWPLASGSVKLNGLNSTFLRPWFHFSDTAPGFSADLNPALCRSRPWTMDLDQCLRFVLLPTRLFRRTTLLVAIFC